MAISAARVGVSHRRRGGYNVRRRGRAISAGNGAAGARVGTDASIRDLARDLKKFYGTKAAVDGVDLEVPRGSFFGFLGPNGAGKVDHHPHAHRSDSGGQRSIEILGLQAAGAGARDQAAHRARARRVAALRPPDRARSFWNSSAGCTACARAIAIERARGLLDLFQLENDRKIIAEYSKGMRKRVAMAASLIHHPELFLMDEPFEGVDAVGARLMKDILQDQVRRGATIFLTSHVLEVVERLCDRVAIIDQGRIVTERDAGGIAGRRRVAGGRVRADRRRGAPDGAAGLAMIGAILRAQWLSMRFGGARRGAHAVIAG